MRRAWERLTGGLRGDVVAGLVAAAVLLTVLLAVIVFVPQIAIDPHGLGRTDWLKAVQDVRTSILQGLGGLAVLAGAVVAALNLRETSRQNRAVQEQNRAVLELQRRGQTTERFTRAIEQLGQQGPEKLDVRIGAVYALEQIARDSAELHWPIMEVLTAYLREHAPVRASAAEAIAYGVLGGRRQADVQAIATVIGRRQQSNDPDGQHLELEETDLSRTILNMARVERAYLGAARLDGADLNDAHLEGAYLNDAHLEGAWLTHAHLEGADLHGTYLEGAHLEGAHLEGADLREARGLSPEQLRAAANPERARLSPEQAAWLAPAAEAPPAVASEGGPEASGGTDPDPR